MTLLSYDKSMSLTLVNRAPFKSSVNILSYLVAYLNLNPVIYYSIRSKASLRILPAICYTATRLGRILREKQNCYYRCF